MLAVAARDRMAAPELTSWAVEEVALDTVQSGKGTVDVIRHEVVYTWDEELFHMSEDEVLEMELEQDARWRTSVARRLRGLRLAAVGRAVAGHAAAFAGRFESWDTQPARNLLTAELVGPHSGR